MGYKKEDVRINNTKTRVVIRDGHVSIHEVNKKDFEKLKKIGYYLNCKTTEIVRYGGVTFFLE